MNTQTAKRHQYRSPPVVEVVLGAQFKPIKTLGIPQLGMLWSQLRDRFPKYEQHPPLSHTVERRGVRAQHPNFEMQLISAGALAPRLWMLNDKGSELLQVQEDRFIRNWRRYDDRVAVYPRYVEHLRPEFEKDLAEFAKFLVSEHHGEPEYDQAEVTYINHIEMHDVWSTHADIGRVLRGVEPNLSAVSGLIAETTGLRSRLELRDNAGEFAGRLHISFDAGLLPGEETSPRPIFVLQLLARGRPLGPGSKGLFEFLDLGHDAIVSTFDKITTDAMQKAWGKVS